MKTILIQPLSATMIFRLTSSSSGLGLNLALIFVALVGMTQSVIAVPQTSADPSSAQTEPQPSVDSKLDELLKTAFQNQQSGKLKLAASQWQNIWEKYPDSQFVGTSRLRAGVCYQQLKDYPLAIENLKVAIPKLTDQLPTAKLLLGYCQFQLGQLQLNAANGLINGTVQKKQASDLLVTATRTLEQLLKTHPKFPDAFQAAYFLGGAYEELDRKQSAIDAYQKVTIVPNPNGIFKYESIYAIGDLYFELGQYGQAKQYFDQFLAAPETKNRADHGLVVFAAAETSIALGTAAKQNGVDGESKQHFTDAEALLKTIVKPVGTDDQAIALARGAERQLAFSYRQLGQFRAAADSYAAIFNKYDASGSAALKSQTAIDAGASYLDAGDAANGEKFLKIAMAATGPRSAEAAHLLANYYLKQRRFGDAYKLSTAFIAAAQPPYLVPLKMNQAEAAIEIEGKLDEAITLFQSIATEYPDHELAAAALYNAAFGQVENDQLESAISTADTFLQRYPNDRYLPDVLEVKGNALSLSGEYSAAEKIFQQLIDNPSFAKNLKRPNWVLSNATAKFQQDNFAGTIAVLQAGIETINQQTKAARALYLMGVSYYQLGQYPEATKNLTSAAIAIDGQSPVADEAQFFLGLSLLKENRFELAQQTIERLAKRSPESRFLNKAYVQLGNNRYQANQQQAAIRWFQKVIDTPQATATEKASAIHGAAWAYLKAQNLDDARRLFKRVIQTYPKSDLVASAKLGLNDARRQAGVDPLPVVSNPVVSNPVVSPPVEPLVDEPDPVKVATGATATKLLRETGLAQVRDKDWAGAVKTFDKLIKTAPDSDQADQDLHELAWAYRSLGNQDQALRYFGEIAAKKPNSRFATEANYHLGKAAYDDQQYPDAIKFFNACVGKDAVVSENEIKATVREKAAYKLAWAYYKQGKFPEAHAAFVRQTELFPVGKLLADGKFMAAESLFRNRQFGPALVAYKVAKPIVDRSSVVEENLKWLTILHGAQSANREQDFQAAIDWTRGIVEFKTGESASDRSFKQDIFLEIGKAYAGLRDSANATEFWNLAKTSLSETGAEATCLIGQQLLQEKKFDDAESEFKKVFFGFGGKAAKQAIRPWQAYALYEAARSNFLRAQASSDPQIRQAYLKIAIKHFQALVDDYPNQNLAAKAKQELKKLTQDP